MMLKTRVQRIKRWLTDPSDDRCPFNNNPRMSESTKEEHCRFCKSIVGCPNKIFCPCTVFGVDEVVEKATKFVNDWDKLHEKGDI